MTTILLLGGYGTTGKSLARHLLAQTDAGIILAGRKIEKAEAQAAALGGGRVTAREVDAAEGGSLKNALQDVDLCLVAAPTTHHTELVMRSCLETETDYLDIQFSKHKLEALQRAKADICRAGLCFVTEAGYHPGLPSAMVRHAASRMDSIVSAVTAGYLNIGPGAPYTEAVDELMEAFIDFDASVFKDGNWTAPKKWEMVNFDFGEGIGKRLCYSMFFEELRCLPERLPGLQNTGFYISGSNWVADLFITPIVMLGLKLAPKRGLRPLGRLMWWGMQQSRPPFEVRIAVEAQGLKNGLPVTVRVSVSHPDGYELTAIPVVAFLKQYMYGSARQPGLHMMGHLGEPVRLLEDMAAMGAEIRRD